jgi:hypothetical protein
MGSTTENPKRHHKRRNVLIGAASLFAVDKVPGFVEWFLNTPSTLGIVKNQELHSTTRSGAVVLNGQDLRSSQDVATSLAPALDVLGPVMYVKYGNNGIVALVK